jgi:hypothetical protein
MRTLTVVLLFAITLNAYGQVPDYVPSDGLVAWYPFNGNANDESPNAHDGVVNGAVLSADRYGLSNSAFFLQTGSYIDFGLSDDFSVTNEMVKTFSYWFYSDSGKQPFLAKYHNSEAWDSNFFIGPRSGGQGIVVTANGASWFEHPIQSGWNSAVVIYRGDESNAELWLNGDFVASNALTFNSQISSKPFLLHCFQYSGEHPVPSGMADDLAVWNRALTEVEIQALYIAEIPISGCTDVGSCNFDADAVVDDGTCHYEDGCGVCGGVSFAGCTDSYACNYDFEAGCDDGSCDYTCCPGPGCCTDGMYWDWDLQGCFITNSTDSNLDGCTDLNDLMDILAAYGDCAVVETNYSLSFDGVDDYVEIPHSTSLDISGEALSIISIAKVNGEDGGHMTTICKTTSVPPYGGYGQISDNANNIWSFSITTNNSWQAVWTQDEYTFNEFETIVGVYDGNSAKIFIDGIQNNMNNTIYGSIKSIDGSVNIGRNPQPNSNPPYDYFNGKIDAILIFDRALSNEEVNEFDENNFNSDGLVGYWNFNEGSGNILYDHSGNGNDGVINGATWSTDVPAAP